MLILDISCQQPVGVVPRLVEFPVGKFPGWSNSQLVSSQVGQIPNLVKFPKWSSSRWSTSVWVKFPSWSSSLNGQPPSWSSSQLVNFPVGQLPIGQVLSWSSSQWVKFPRPFNKTFNFFVPPSCLFALAYWSPQLSGPHKILWSPYHGSCGT